jgi:hypothetical protein
VETLRERREHRVFQTLLHSIAGLEERLMEGSDEEVAHVAELVCLFILLLLLWDGAEGTPRYKRALPAPDQMTQRA